MKEYFYPPEASWKLLTERPTVDLISLQKTVKEVFEKVKIQGDKGLIDTTKQFDKVTLENLNIEPSEIRLNPELEQAIRVAKKNIESFHLAQKKDSKLSVETQKGVDCWIEKRPIEKVGIYVPGGNATLFSSALMMAVPAKIAGCKEIVLCSPPNEKGTLSDELLFVAKLCEIDTIVPVGGIQAIAALTFGTDSVPKVDKILGPGNQYVTAAKQYATNLGVSIDFPAGPSELLVVMDNTATLSFVAADLLSQAEHGEDSQVILVTTHKALLTSIEDEIQKQLKHLPRKTIAQKALKNSKAIVFETDEQAIRFINTYAPEHFIINVENSDFYIKNIVNAGSVFVGNYTPESAGDYASGTNHVLPTQGYAKQYSGVNLDSFRKSLTFQKISPKGIQNLGPTIEQLAAAEGLEAHKNAVSIRLKELK